MNINPTSLQAFDCNCTTVTFQKREKKEDELSSLNWKVEFLGTEVAVQKPRKCDHVTRLLNARRVNLGIDNVMLEIGPPPYSMTACFAQTALWLKLLKMVLVRVRCGQEKASQILPGYLFRS